jgi:hypothetical protein
MGMNPFQIYALRKRRVKEFETIRTAMIDGVQITPNLTIASRKRRQIPLDI